MNNALNNVRAVLTWFFLCVWQTGFAQSVTTFELKGNNNEVHNQQTNTYQLNVDLLVCMDPTVAGGSYIKPINAFVDLADWCIAYLHTHLLLPDGSRQTLYENVYQIKNANDEVRTLRLINETLDELQRQYGRGRHLLTPAQVDVFHQKYDELRSFRILNCLGDRFKLKRSEISGLRYLETDSPQTDVRQIDFELFRMSEGIRMVRINGRYGYTENDSTFCINPVFGEAHPFSNGLALVKNHTESWFIDKKSHVVLSLTTLGYLQVWPFSNGYARVQKASYMYNFIDTTGRELFPFDLQWADDFSCGMAAVCVNPTGFYELLKTLPGYARQARQLKRLWQLDGPPLFGSRCGYMDVSGFFRLRPVYTSALSFTEHGRAPVQTAAAESFSKAYLIDTTGGIRSGKYGSIKPYGDGLWLARCTEHTYGVFDPSGLLLADCFYGEPVWADPFLVYRDAATHKYGVMDKSGMVVVPAEYEAIRCLDNAQFELQKEGYTTTVYIGTNLKINKIKRRQTGE